MNIPNMTKVSSTMVRSAGYDSTTNSMFIEYSNGIYVYENVPVTLYEGLMSAESKGKYMIHNIRGKYKSNKIK